MPMYDGQSAGTTSTSANFAMIRQQYRRAAQKHRNK